MRMHNKLEPLKISCKTADCENNLHCFLISKKHKEELFPQGTCNYCGVRLVDWGRVQLNRIHDVEFTIESLQKEWIRHHFWHEQLPQRAINFALRKGIKDLLLSINKRIEIALKPMHPFRDGIQTPFSSDNPIHYAQHATATCCRHCLNYWHGIPENRELTLNETEYIGQLLYKYLEKKIPNLSTDKQKIPPIRNK